jgi:DNA-binding response OmpR family regulator
MTEMEQVLKAKILIVDDDPSFCEMLCQILTTRNYQVETEHTGMKGILQAKVNVPSGIILDFRLPDMNAYDFCHYLKEFPQTRKVPVMVVSGFQQKLDNAQLAAMGISIYLEKPFKNSDFLDSVERLLKSIKRNFS